jgi:pyruvate/2-oxoglutarate dehydrogenase complex dihydrolipoamide dehydrogenase (E3) component
MATNDSPTTTYDVLILGSGQGGTPLASAFAAAGKRTALIERAYVGGTCVNVGCTPTKTMVASGRVAYLARRGKDYGVHFPGDTGGEVKVDMKEVRRRKRNIVDSFRGGSERRVNGQEGLELLMGEARFVGEKEVEVTMNEGGGKMRVKGGIVVINTGERPRRPDVEGVESVEAKRVLDSTSVMELDEVPEHLLVLGGGVIGLEFGQLMRRLGAKVTIVQRGKQLLPREDADVAEEMLKILKEDGITVLLDAKATKLSSSSDSPVVLSVSGADGTQSLSGSHVLFAAGRAPNTDMLDLSKTSVDIDSRGHVKVNDRLETSAPGIYAIGDVKGGPAFTHVSYDDFRVVKHNLIGPNTPSSYSASSPLTITARALQTPYVTFTDPQLAHVGLHASEARAKYPDRKIQTTKMPMAWVARALETDETRGLMKGVVDADSGEILGFTCLGVEGGEIMSQVQMAMRGGLKWWDLRDMCLAHPTFAESLNNVWGFLE